jgi:hypothetical protein
MRFLEELYILLERFLPEGEHIFPFIWKKFVLVLRYIGMIFERFNIAVDKIFDNLIHYIGVLWKEMGKLPGLLYQVAFNGKVMPFIFEHWTEILTSIGIVALFLAHQFFPRWKQAHLHSYALCEIGVGVIAIASVLPWSDGILEFESYGGLIASTNILVTAAKIMGGIYLGVRGEENRQKAVAVKKDRAEEARRFDRVEPPKNTDSQAQ